ncbi:hypothetical protein LZ32DRAFT_611068 [Colletotrichum eremochloae]|nr:hypothetical protein LZ32DRAFT_611068 [Colletotrichum eremochloae]
MRIFRRRNRSRVLCKLIQNPSAGSQSHLMSSICRNRSPGSHRCLTARPPTRQIGSSSTSRPRRP